MALPTALKAGPMVWLGGGGSLPVAVELLGTKPHLRRPRRCVSWAVWPIAGSFPLYNKNAQTHAKMDKKIGFSGKKWV